MPELWTLGSIEFMNLLVHLANAVVNMWRARSLYSKPSMFSDPAEDRRSRFWLTVIAVFVTLFAIALAAGVVYLLWSAFTTHERHAA